MPALTSMLLIGGLALGGAGLYQQTQSSKAMAASQKEQIAAQQQIEAQRKKQMDLEYRRQQLQVLRNQQRARAMSLATATAQGVNHSSVLQGAYGSESGQANTQGLAGSQNYGIGNAIFGINAGLSNSKMSYADAQSSFMAGSGMASLGGMMVTNAGTLGSAVKSAGSSFGMPPTGFNSPWK